MLESKMSLTMKKFEGRDLEEYLQEVWDSLESAWDKSKFDMKQGYDSEYDCDCITITSKDKEGVRAKIYVNDYEGRHPVGFDVVYRYPGDNGVGVRGSYEFQSTDMDGLGEEVFDYFDEIKKRVGETMKNEATTPDESKKSESDETSWALEYLEETAKEKGLKVSWEGSNEICISIGSAPYQDHIFVTDDAPGKEDTSLELYVPVAHINTTGLTLRDVLDYLDDPIGKRDAVQFKNGNRSGKVESKKSEAKSRYYKSDDEPIRVWFCYENVADGDDDLDGADEMAVFVDSYANGKFMIYSHIGQHGEAVPDYIKGCPALHEPKKSDLYKELTKIVGYNLEVVDTNVAEEIMGISLYDDEARRLGEYEDDYDVTLLKNYDESKKNEADAAFKVGDFVSYEAGKDGKDPYDAYVYCEVIGINDDGTLDLCPFGTDADTDGIGDNANPAYCEKLDHFAGMVDAHHYYMDGKYNAYKGGWEILITDKELNPKVYEFIGTIDGLSEVIDIDDYYGGENFVFDEDLKDEVATNTGWDVETTTFADMTGDVGESKKSESLTLKQKELKDMVRFGQAEDITTISDAEAKELKKKGIETVGISRGTYGMNGALLRDSEGNKYVITARSSNLFYFV